jgi:2-hydroxychromene-2-carboxylate isomerase
VPAPTVEFFYDLMSPYSYLAATRLEAIAERTNATIQWKPLYLPGVMKAVENKGPTAIPAKAMYSFKDLNDWTQHYGLPPLVLPDPFPFVAAQADRALLAAAPLGKLVALTHAFFRAIWVDGKNCNDAAVLAAVIQSQGLEPASLLATANSDEIRNQLRANTDDAIARGAFGVPTYFVNGEMFVGNDRLFFVEAALKRGA